MVRRGGENGEIDVARCRVSQRGISTRVRCKSGDVVTCMAGEGIASLFGDSKSRGQI